MSIPEFFMKKQWKNSTYMQMYFTIDKIYPLNEALQIKKLPIKFYFNLSNY